MISRETAKQESSSTSDNKSHSTTLKAAAASSTSWARLKDPRIVRVSRAFGGKDRHSKVCTVRGLRDRRVRLSVPTAIQLYDLQDRLGLNQPSKVVDWLLNAAKSEIDELPPLHFPQGGAAAFSPSLLPMLDNINQDKSKELSSLNNQDNSSYHVNENPLINTSSSTSIPFNSFVRWDPSNLTLSHPPRSPNCSPPPHHHHHNQAEDWHNFSLVAPLQPHHHHHQVLVYQPAAGMAAQPYFQSEISASNAEFDMKQIGNYQTSSPNVESSTHFNMTANLLPSQNNDGGR